MQFRRILIILIVMIFMTGTLTAKAATPTKSTALEPWNTEIVDKISEGFVGPFVSIDHYERDGRAYISYYDAENGDLKLANQVDPGTGNCPGNTNWKCTTVDSANDVGQYSSIEVTDGIINLGITTQGELEAPAPIVVHYAKIGISYFDATQRSLKFALRTCSTLFSCSWNITEVDDDTATMAPDIVGEYSSFDFGTDDIPIIYYNEHNNINPVGRVKRAYLPTGNNFLGSCGAGWTCDVIAAAENSSFGSYISSDGGKVAFYNNINSSLVLASQVSVDTNTCLLTGGMNRWDCVIVDLTGDVGKFSSIYYDEYDPAIPTQIAYYDFTNGRVKYAIKTAPGTGTCYNTNYNCFAVDDIGQSTTTSIGIALTLDAQNQPIIAYQDFHEEMASARLKLARPASVYNQLIGNCGGLPPGYSFYYWQCSLLDSSGHQEVHEADYAAISVNPIGLATVAYYESDEYYSEGRLKVAQQHFGIYLPLISK